MTDKPTPATIFASREKGAPDPDQTFIRRIGEFKDGQWWPGEVVTTEEYTKDPD